MNEPKPCFVCGCGCFSKEKSEDLVRCPDCLFEESKMRDPSFDYIDEREARERIA
jgi:hypothetical protein